jgi:hypothetical protein
MENIDIFAPVRDHPEIKFEGGRIYVRGRLDWTARVDITIARDAYANVDEAITHEGVWIKVLPVRKEHNTLTQEERNAKVS